MAGGSTNAIERSDPDLLALQMTPSDVDHALSELDDALSDWDLED